MIREVRLWFFPLLKSPTISKLQFDLQCMYTHERVLIVVRCYVGKFLMQLTCNVFVFSGYCCASHFFFGTHRGHPKTLRVERLLKFSFFTLSTEEKSPQSRQRRNTALCGGRPYNPRKQICCSGVLQPSPDYPYCCGTQAYNARTHMCCDGTVWEAPIGFPLCCGTRAYDARYGICCRGVYWSTRNGITQPKCCGYRAYDSRKYKCCQGRVRSTC